MYDQMIKFISTHINVVRPYTCINIYIYIYIYVIYVEQLIISSGYPVDHADSSHSALYNSYHGDGRIASLILIDYSTTQYTYYAIRYTVYFLQYFKIFPL